MADPTPSRRTSIASRHTIRRQSSRLSVSESLVDVFADDNEVNFIPVADGFRPGFGHDAPAQSPSPPPSSTSQPLQPPPRAASPPRVTEYLKKRLAGQERPSGPPHRSSSSTARRDGPLPQRVGSMASVADSTARPLSTVSGLSTPVSESPYTVSSGPSHPYGMYPQVGSLNRAASTSTVQTQNRPYSGPNRPAHPYAMYPQIPGGAQVEPNTDPFADPADIANVGFPDPSRSYARPLGPDGEDADDLIGPDGHLEQLPPYSRYPNDIPPKERTSVPEARVPLLPSGIAEPSSQSTLREPPSEPHLETSSAVSLLDNEDGTRINTAAARAAGEETVHRSQRWKEKGRRRTCWGKVPVWAWIVLVAILCLIAAILGGLIGRFVAHPHPPSSPSQASNATSTATGVQEQNGYPPATATQFVTTTPIDAAPLSATPSNLPPLPTGTFALALGGPNTSAAGCLSAQNQKSAWGCSGQSYLKLQVNDARSGGNTILLTAEYPKDYPLFYGAQAPSLRNPAPVTLMEDLNDPNSGPAYYFQQLYDKLVIVPENDVNFSSQTPNNPRKAKRDDDDLSWLFDGQDAYPDDVQAYLEERDSLPLDTSFQDLEARGGNGPNGPNGPKPVVTGDLLWYCFWNSTIVEGFIYATVNSTPSASETQYVASMAASDPDSAPPATASANPTGTPPRRRGDTQNQPTSSGSSPRATHPPTSLYPRAVDLEERRVSGMPQPYCQQMQATMDGLIVPKLDSNNNEIQFNLTEKEPLTQHNVRPNTGGNPSFNKFKQRSLWARGNEACRCAWNCS